MQGEHHQGHVGRPVSTERVHEVMRRGDIAHTDWHQVRVSLVPRPLPDFILQLCRKIRRRPGIKTSGP